MMQGPTQPHSTLPQGNGFGWPYRPYIAYKSVWPLGDYCASRDTFLAPATTGIVGETGVRSASTRLGLIPDRRPIPIRLALRIE